MIRVLAGNAAWLALIEQRGDFNFYYIGFKWTHRYSFIMFYLIQFDEIDTDDTKQLQHELSGYPNGTILSCSQRIKISNLPCDKWIVWIDRHIVNMYPEQYDSFAKIKGIKHFIELDIKKTPNDVDWIWDDRYIDHLFMDVV